MNLLVIAGALAVILGLVHSGLGEKLIFSGWRQAAPDIPRRHRNIIWASWHLVTICCVAFGIILLGIGLGLILELASKPSYFTPSRPPSFCPLCLFFLPRAENIRGGLSCLSLLC